MFNPYDIFCISEKGKMKFFCLLLYCNHGNCKLYFIEFLYANPQEIGRI